MFQQQRSQQKVKEKNKNNKKNKMENLHWDAETIDYEEIKETSKKDNE